jgi:hypothetical protein
VLLARRVYRTDLDQFDAVYGRCGGDLRRAVVQIIAIARANRRDPFAGLRAWVAHPGAQVSICPAAATSPTVTHREASAERRDGDAGPRQRRYGPM